MILVTGTYPPEQCGVADYSYNLLHTKTSSEADWKLVYTKDSSIKAFRKTINEIMQYSDTLVNIQYPSRGYAKSVLPHLLCFYLRCFTNKKVSVTIHEYTQLGWKGTLCAYILLWFADILIFTNNFELEAAAQKVSGVRKKSSVIKIFTNIPSAKCPKPIPERRYDIGYFGYIRPEKGIEAFIDTISGIIKEKKTVKAFVMGQQLPDLKDFAANIISKAKAVGIEIIEGREDSEVAKILADTKIAYLPFPDGLSERRGSFMAFAKNHAIIVTTDGAFVTNEQRALLNIGSVEQCYAIIKSILESSPEEQLKQQRMVQEYVQNNLPASWDEVAQAYKNLEI